MSIFLLQIEDKDTIKHLLEKDDMYKHLIGADIPDDFDPRTQHIAWYAVIDNNAVVGVVCLTGFTSNCICFHGGVYKKARGANSLRYFLESLTEVRKLYKQEIIFTVLPSNKKTKNLIKKAGYKYKTTIIRGSAEGPLEIYAEE